MRRGVGCAVAIGSLACAPGAAAKPATVSSLKRIFRSHHPGLKVGTVRIGTNGRSGVFWLRPAAPGSPEATHHADAAAGVTFYRGTREVPAKGTVQDVGVPAAEWIGVVQGTGMYTERSFDTVEDDDGNTVGTAQVSQQVDAFHFDVQLGPDIFSLAQSGFSFASATSTTRGTVQNTDSSGNTCTGALGDPYASDTQFSYQGKGAAGPTSGRTEQVKLSMSELESTGSCLGFVPAFDATGTVRVPSAAWHTFTVPLTFAKDAKTESGALTSETASATATFYVVGFDDRGGSTVY